MAHTTLAKMNECARYLFVLPTLSEHEQMSEIIATVALTTLQISPTTSGVSHGTELLHIDVHAASFWQPHAPWQRASCRGTVR